MHLSKEIWGPDAEEFNPNRWFSPDIAKKERYFMPVSLLGPSQKHGVFCAENEQWSAGWASCPGQHLAKVQFFKIIAT